ncbi:MAG: hypothetical protein JRC68_08415 [Deltaproteobacteria bacterium]|nr:hypothetical protein [Deltaproteobacteria bacterium]
MDKAVIYPCPDCQSIQTWRNGRSKKGKQVFLCKECGRSFIWPPGTSRKSKDLDVNCPGCNTKELYRQGISKRNGRQVYQCRHCGKCFTWPSSERVPAKTKKLITGLLQEGLRVKVISRLTSVSVSTIYKLNKNL